MTKQETELDNLIKSKVAGLKPRYFIEPSVDFTRRVMNGIKVLERHRRWMGYFAAVVLSMTPLAVREIWMFVRGDYFSASSLPLGNLIIGVYKFFLSPAALYILLALGILAFLLRANKLRRDLGSSFIKIA
ncbi:MAG: hypothetical protein HYX20_01245 [Candidatus Yanofskybacteria bacterium]|nr:hypothetical protein [Candidatus Yanofskybacteria bacterium]